MCGRYELNETPARLGSRYRVESGDLKFARNDDVRSTDTNPVILLAGGQRIASMRRWGIVPFGTGTGYHRPNAALDALRCFSLGAGYFGR